MTVLRGLTLRYDLRSGPTGADHSVLYAAALDQCAWADALPADEVRAVSVILSEHHGSEDGYLPSPFVLAAAIAGRTRRARVNIAAALLPLYDPVRLAEDMAVLDLVSAGRVDVVLGAGYRAEEFAAFGVDITHRGALMEEALAVLERAWSGELFEHRGATIRVTPRPLRRPRPPLVLAGSSAAAARRAARLADGFMPSVPELLDTYRDEVVRLGRDPGPKRPAPAVPMIVLVDDDPERGWATVGPHCLHDMRAYAAWLRAGRGATGPHHEVADLDELEATGMYRVVTPEECVELVRPTGRLLLHPLAGGVPPDVAWRGLELVRDRVLPLLSSAPVPSLPGAAP